MLSPKARISLLDRSKKRIVIALGLAVLMHLPATPALPLMRMLHRFAVKNQSSERTKPAPPMQVEVELQQANRIEEKRQQKAAEAEAKAEEKSTHQASLAMSPPPPAAPIPFGQTKAPEPPKEEASNKPAEPKKERLKDIGLEGDKSKKDEVRPGVTLGLWLSSLRDNPLGRELAQMASCDRQWRTFSEQGIDLVNDFDGVLIVGPSLFEPGQLTAAVRHSLPSGRVREVVDALVKKSGSKGRWLASNVAEVKIGRESRMLIPQQDDLFFVAPSKGWEALHRLKQPMKVPSSDGRLASLIVTKPNQVLSRLGLQLPSRIESLRLEAYVYSDQSGDIKVELEDTEPKAAVEDLNEVSTLLSEFFSDAWLLTSTLSNVTGAAQQFGGPELAPKLSMATSDNVITGTARLTAGQTQNTMNLLRSLMCRNKSKSNTKPPGGPSLAAKAE